MLVEIDKSVKHETIELDYKVKNEQYEVLLERDNVNLTVNFMWDSHGNLVPSKSNEEYVLMRMGVNIKVTKYSCVNIIGEHEVEQESWLLDVDGERINGDVYEYNVKGNNAVMTVVVGWG